MILNSYSHIDDGIVIHTTEGNIRVRVLASSILHITYTLEAEFSTRQSLSVLPHISSGQVNWSASEDDVNLILNTDDIILSISRDTCSFTYLTTADELLTKEPDRGGKELVPFNLYKTSFDESEIRTEHGADGLKVRTDGVKRLFDRRVYHTKLRFQWSEDEGLYGLGSHEEGLFNLRGCHRYLYQQNMKAVIPFLISTRGYAFLIDSYSDMIFRDDVYGSYIRSETDDELDYYFIYGPEFDDLVKGYRKLTGEAPMLPKWAYGYIQSKERYMSADELISTISEYRRLRIPLDCIVLDWCSWEDGLWGQKTLDPIRFPDPKGMMDAIHNLNAQLMVSIWPIMRNDGENHQEMKERGFLLGNQATYDAFNPEARELYWDQANKGLFSHGVDAWWCDCTEPFESDWLGAVKPEPEERLRLNTEEAKTYLDAEFINAYSLQHSKGIYEGQRKTTSGKRVVNLTRSAYAGQQRYAAITWSGDISANWGTLKRQVAEGLNFCASGAPYWTFDIGAFFVANREQWFWDGDYDGGCDDMGYRELYTRWLQLGAFMPMFRSHGTDTPREVWRFGEPGTMFRDAITRFIELRYRLLPYIYSLAGMVTMDNYTIMRALAFDFRHDKAVYDIADQFMFGPSLLVCPITTAMYFGSGSTPVHGIPQTRSVYLPSGKGWYDFWTDDYSEGGVRLTANAPIDIIPLLIPEGAILPMGPVIQYSSESVSEPLELLVYTGADGSFTLYEDAGDSYSYEDGEYARTPIKWADDAQTLTIGPRSGSYPGMADKIDYRVIMISRDGRKDFAEFGFDGTYVRINR